MKTWIEPSPVIVPDALRDFTGGHDLIAQTLVRRGLDTVAAAQAFLDPAYYRPASPYDLPDMDKAVERLRRAIKAGEPICVWGDFDVDGQTSTALLVGALRELGAEVSYHIPNRMSEGHGIQVAKLAEKIAAGARVILTCDTGIAAHEAVDYAQSRGVDVVITDHHQLPETLPDAYARVNPQRLAAGHPLRTLPGVGTAYKLVEALVDGRDTTRFLDLVALGIVADVATISGDTRYLLQQGLQVLRETARPGLQEMLRLAELKPAELSEQHIGFVLGPRLNALGRLADANPAVELLTSHDPEVVRVLAVQLEGLNNERKLQSSQVYGGAKAQIEKDPSLLDYGVLVLSHADWPGGVVGIVASRLVEEYNRPVILLHVSDDGVARGSARSVAGCDITAAIGAQRDLLLGYGGHTMAAGMSLPADKIADFRRGLSRTVGRTLGTVAATPTLAIDGYLDLGDLSLGLVQDVERLAPFGPGNTPLTLATRNLRLQASSTIGRRREHLSLTVEDENGQTHKVMWWQASEDDLPRGRFDLAYTVRASDYKGKSEVLVEWVDFRPVAEADAVLDWQAAEIAVADYRLVSDPAYLLREIIQEEPGIQVWREVLKTPDGQTRQELRPAGSLVVWTVPPGAAEWRAVLEYVQPTTLYLFALDADVDSFERFITRLSGLVKHVLKAKDGVIDRGEMAAAMGHRAVTVQAGLDWLAAKGVLQPVVQAGERLQLRAGGSVDENALRLAEAQLTGLLAETRAYRAYWREAAGYNLVRRS